MPGFFHSFQNATLSGQNTQPASVHAVDGYNSSPAQVCPVACDFQRSTPVFRDIDSQRQGSLDKPATAAYTLVLTPRTPLLSKLARQKGTHLLVLHQKSCCIFLPHFQQKLLEQATGSSFNLSPQASSSGYSIPYLLLVSGFAENRKELYPIVCVLCIMLEEHCYFLVQYPTFMSVCLSSSSFLRLLHIN